MSLPRGQRERLQLCSGLEGHVGCGFRGSSTVDKVKLLPFLVLKILCCLFCVRRLRVVVMMFRAKTTYNHEKENGELIIHAEPSTDRIWVAYFAPFTVEQHYELVSWCGQQKDLEDTPLASIQTLTSTLDGRPLDMVVSGTGSAKCYFIARQHPGESMAEWWMKGFLQRLLDPRDSVARKLRAAATFFIVPNMNPDGSFRGHLRTNASGANLNREWGNTADYLAPSQERSPEVFAVMKNLEKTGCDLFVDVHGDEELPHIFFAGTQGIPNWSDRLCELLRIFTNAQLKASPEFQIGHGYDNDESCKANLAVCGDSVASKYDCLAVTLEMPFKDTLGEHQCQTEGWSPDRCIRFGATMLDAVSEVLPFLRKEFPFNNGGIGDGLEIPGPFQLGYKNPPSGEAFDTTA